MPIGETCCVENKVYDDKCCEGDTIAYIMVDETKGCCAAIALFDNNK